jgi:hypothetical protein
MDGRVYTFSIDTTSKRTAAWADYGVSLSVVHLDEQRVHTNVRIQIGGWPGHTHVGFNFNRLTSAVEGLVVREPTREEVAKCRAQPKGPWLDYCESDVVVGEVSHGTCQEITRAFETSSGLAALREP